MGIGMHVAEDDKEWDEAPRPSHPNTERAKRREPPFFNALREAVLATPFERPKREPVEKKTGKRSPGPAKQPKKRKAGRSHAKARSR